MPILITFEEALKLKARSLIPVKCDVCEKLKQQTKHSVIRIGYNDPRAKIIFNTKNRFCSTECHKLFFNKKQKVICKQCNKSFEKNNAECIKTPNHFCSHSCSAIYSNTHKTTGVRRSKLEQYLEKELTKLFPTLEILYNNRQTLGYELDIYVPSLRLAFELNGIFHYEPIYGQEKLNSIQFNDAQKFALCQQKLISLCVIDSTSLKYFKEEKAKKFLDIILKIIRDKMVPNSGNAPDLKR